jgi:putative membrane protein
MRKTFLIVAAALFAVGCSKAKAENNTNPNANSPSGASTMQTTPSQPAPAGAMQGDTQTGQQTQGAGESGTMPGDTQAADSTSGRGAMGTMPMEMFTPQMTIDKIHAINHEEIEAGKMAKKNGTKEIHSYADKLVSDHEKADKELSSVAKKMKLKVQDPSKVQWPASVQQQMQSDQQMTAQLKDMKGGDFDKQFLTMMDDGHTRALDFLKQAQDNVQDAQLKQFITQLEPTIEQHKKMAQDLINRVGAKVQGRR